MLQIMPGEFTIKSATRALPEYQERSIKKGEFWHRIMLAVARPQPRFGGYRAGRNQGVTRFQRMALAVTSQVVSGTATDSALCWNAEQSLKQSLNGRILGWASSSPKLGSTDSGEKDRRIGSAEFEPLRNDRLVPSSGDLDQDIRVDEDGHRSTSRSSLEPRRSSLTSSLLSLARLRDFRIPTKLCIAAMRSSGRPRYRSRTACRTSSEIVVFSLRARA
jgi:hypothetical protein